MSAAHDVYELGHLLQESRATSFYQGTPNLK
jgi:hypothetical protein